MRSGQLVQGSSLPKGKLAGQFQSHPAALHRKGHRQLGLALGVEQPASDEKIQGLRAQTQKLHRAGQPHQLHGEKSPLRLRCEDC